MIISHKHKFIFIKTVKTAGTSVEILLSTICGNNDIITAVSPDDELIRKKINGCGPINTAIPFSKYSVRNILGAIKKGKRLHFYNHMSASQIKQFISPAIWDSYYKFCYERHPIDKFISWYKWKGGDQRFGSINNFLNSSIARELRGSSLYTINNKVVVDDIFQFEKMAESIATINTKLGTDLSYQDIPHTKAKSNIDTKSMYHTDEVLEFVRKYYSLETEMVEYQI